MRTTRDGIEQMVERAQVMARDGMGPVVLAPTVLHMLRLERRRVRRMVQQHQQAIKLRAVGFERLDGYLMACTDLLAALKETP